MDDKMDSKLNLIIDNLEEISKDIAGINDSLNVLTILKILELNHAGCLHICSDDYTKLKQSVARFLL